MWQENPHVSVHKTVSEDTCVLSPLWIQYIAANNILKWIQIYVWASHMAHTLWYFPLFVCLFCLHVDFITNVMGYYQISLIFTQPQSPLLATLSSISACMKTLWAANCTAAEVYWPHRDLLQVPQILASNSAKSMVERRRSSCMYWDCSQNHVL